MCERKGETTTEYSQHKKNRELENIETFWWHNRHRTLQT